MVGVYATIKGQEMKIQQLQKNHKESLERIEVLENTFITILQSLEELGDEVKIFEMPARSAL